MRQDVPDTLPAVMHAKQEGYFRRLCEYATELVQQLDSNQLQQLKYALAMSDFIAENLIRHPELIDQLFRQASMFSEHVDLTVTVHEQVDACRSEQELHQVLRQLRNRYMTHIAYVDLCAGAPIEVSFYNLSHLADTLICAANNWLYKRCAEQWGIPQDAQGNEQPLLVYGMGKLGGRELNFSSDIDLIFCFPENGETSGSRRSLDNQTFFTRLGQKLIAALDQVTVDGFVYRVDMRLRPFGDSGPLVLSFAAMETYYQEQGRDWERYAMLKARLIGDSPYHGQLRDMLRPFVYRRYIDFSVIESLRQMKMMIAQEARRRQLQQNIKLGIGGIREIEFIVQVFQLMRGGRIPQLQQRNCMRALALLEQYDCVSVTSRQQLEHAYYVLRRIENAIQAFNDQQTQQLPSDELNQARLVSLLAADDWQQVLSLCEQHMQAVNREFNLLIGEENGHSQSAQEHWQTLWQADWQPQDATEFIAEHQPEWPADKIYKALDDFRDDVKKRSIGNRGRLILDKLIPALLHLLAEQVQPLVSLQRVLQVLSKIVTRTVYLELLLENPPAFSQLIRLCRASSWISDYLSRYPLLLDELIDPKLLYAIPSLADYQRHLQEQMMRVPEDDLEAQMETLRQFKQAKHLKIAAADITGILPVMQVSDHLTAVAQSVITMAVNLAWQQMVHRYGQPNSTLGSDDKRFAVIGYGKLGGIELGYGSDLDLVFIHQCDPQDHTNGEKSIPSSQFYLKLAQRVMHLFNTRTASGILYEIDMRLRPSGNSGLMVIHVDTFATYQQHDAWTWEHQALTRARFIYGDSALQQGFDTIRQDILSQERDSIQLRQDVIEMRQKMRAHLDKSDDQVFDIKQGQGGLADIEFLAQFLLLKYCHKQPNLCQFSDNVRMFEQLHQAGLLSQRESQQLINAYCSLRDKGHALTLQNKPTLVSQADFDELRQQVISCWDKYLG
ncbi:bifunctional [glutamate--ammonia ligase]-adenylyl-L-tyrosine phosphorylase/[glutamate--ammonia-ligase] adenylyltransferase [Thalassotalea maritima]|uniref:bifunctional [glutamate--ammonia ligase]-adenylyl-L-tyrosine phosphorylase/[glutamate--ammonia-ligase] adenylyltransferase n=1 Tax=Thalassotalea maritima TaxID=3242416 RepID=UPI00352883D0